MYVSGNFIWKKIPLLRPLIALISGITIQWYCQLENIFWLSLLLGGLAGLLAGFLLPIGIFYKLRILFGLFMHISVAGAGGLLTWQKDIRNSHSWFGHHYQNASTVIATLEEPLVEKTRSFKAEASISHVVGFQKKLVPVKGKIIIYFRKDSLHAPLQYGSQVIFAKPLQEIRNAGNPGGFDYKRYSLFQEITHQVFLKQGEFRLLPKPRQNIFTAFLLDSRQEILNVLRSYINGSRELGLAEALLIGYKDDLDKTLVQSYTNTGVVHIIAISGLHLGLIYWLLITLMRPFSRITYLRWLEPVVTICGLWLFTLLAGAQPSILRAAFMFTSLVLGKVITRKGSVYNALTLSAFMLLVWNPFWLWDVGFQLSYSAVLGITIFLRPIYNLLFFKNKILDFIWKLNAVTLAAQVLTLPVSIYHFHQFPVHFLLTNFLAVPLSSLILFGEILLCMLAFVPALDYYLGILLSVLIRFMNTYIEKVEALPYSLWDGLQINLPQCIFLFLFITGLYFWLMEKSWRGLIFSLITLMLFFSLRSYSFLEAARQNKLIVYNVPQRQAIDVVEGRYYHFIGDSALLLDDFARNFHLKPSRILHRSKPGNTTGSPNSGHHVFICGKKQILILDHPVSSGVLPEKPTIDLMVISKNAGTQLPYLANRFSIHQIVFDGSNRHFRLNAWKKQCDSLSIPYHDVAESGAFVMNLN